MTKKSNDSRQKRADLYDEGDYNYLHYWEGRDYEHASEQMAIKRLLKGRTFKHAVDIGGGYGRLCVFLKRYADKVTLAEPSKKQLEIAKDYLKNHKDIDQRLMQADKLTFKTNSVDLITMIRVMHHLPDPSKEFAEIARALEEDGYLILEVANFAHAKNRISYGLKRQKLPTKPVDIRSPENQRDDEVPFVNHNPKTVIKQLAHAGLKVERTLSVSNLRSPRLKKLLPLPVMTTIERALQPALAKSYFGPSVFFLVRRVK
jgi:ubiquinone/menaquinone biosynthesis C-methylase UbiE